MTKTITVLVLLVLFGKEGFGQSNGYWEWVHPKPQGNDLLWLKAWDANTWYAAGIAGTFIKTTNAGLNWFINSIAGEYDPSIDYSKNIYTAHFFDQNTGIIGGDRRLKRTTNAGITFDSIPGTYTSSTWYSLYFLNNNTGYAGASNGTLLKTTNGGLNWTQNTNITFTSQNRDIITLNDTLLILTSTSGNIKRSTNSGQSWTQISTGSSATLYKSLFINKDTGFVCGTSTAIRMTTNSGLNWTNINTGIPATSFLKMNIKKFNNNYYIYLAGTSKNIYRSSNFGISWDSINMVAPNQYIVNPLRAFEVLGQDSLVAVGDYGQITKKFGADFISLSTRYKSDLNALYDISVDKFSGKIWAVGVVSGTGIFDQVLYSPDKGTTWNIQQTPDGTTIYTGISMVNENTGYICGNAGKISKTINGGNTWTALTSPTAYNLNKIDFVNSSTGWIFGVAGTIYKTSDGGLSWIQQFPADSVVIRGADMIDLNTGWFIGSNGKINKTINGGINWISQNSNTNVSLYDIKMITTNIGYICGDVDVVRKTVDGGNNWDTVMTPFSNFTYIGLDFSDSLFGMIGALGQGISLKTNTGGQTWEIYNAHSPTGVFSINILDTNNIFAAGDWTIFRHINTLVPIATWENTVASQYELCQNYPNPFNPVTKIVFSLSKPGNVKLKVFDIAGREVSSIINHKLNKGKITVNFDASALASGVYFYSLEIDEQIIDVKKMVLLK